MNQQASRLNNKSIAPTRPARVISIRNTGRKKGKKTVDNNVKGELPLFNNERIFKAKKHDPL